MLGLQVEEMNSTSAWWDEPTAWTQPAYQYGPADPQNRSSTVDDPTDDFVDPAFVRFRDDSRFWVQRVESHHHKTFSSVSSLTSAGSGPFAHHRDDRSVWQRRDDPHSDETRDEILHQRLPNGPGHRGLGLPSGRLLALSPALPQVQGGPHPRVRLRLLLSLQLMADGCRK